MDINSHLKNIINLKNPSVGADKISHIIFFTMQYLPVLKKTIEGMESYQYIKCYFFLKKARHITVNMI